MAQDSHNSSQETPPGPESKKSFFRDNPGFYLTVSYIVISIVGLALEAIFLAQFDIFILSYAEVNDFLFSFVKLFPAVFISILMFSAYLILLFLGLSYLDTVRHEFEFVRRAAPETAVKRLAARSGQWLQNTAQAIAFFFNTGAR